MNESYNHVKGELSAVRHPSQTHTHTHTHRLLEAMVPFKKRFIKQQQDAEKRNNFLRDRTIKKLVRQQVQAATTFPSDSIADTIEGIKISQTIAREDWYVVQLIV